jgi:hypothetical protein
MEMKMVIKLARVPLGEVVSEVVVAASQIRKERVKIAGLLDAVADRLRAYKATGWC